MTFREYIEYYNQIKPPFKSDGYCAMNRCRKCEKAYTYHCYGCDYAKDHYLTFRIDEDDRVMNLKEALEVVEGAMEIASEEGAIYDADLSAALQILNKALGMADE